MIYMPSLSQRSNKAALLLAALLAAGDAAAALSLGILDACEPMRAIVGKLAAGPAGLRDCREPRDSLERQYAARVARRGMKLCLLRDAPVPLLASFSCVNSPVASGVGIVCFRRAALSDVRAYKAAYGESLALAEERYLTAAAACPVSTGDTARSPSTMFPMFLTEVAAFQIGFVNNIRYSGKESAVLLHGYADVDPDLEGNVPSALEYVSAYMGPTQSSEKTAARRLGNWSLTIDNDGGMAQAFNDMAAKNHFEARLSNVTFEFEKSTGDRTSEEKAAFLSKTSRDIARQFKEEGFQLVSAATFEAQTGIQKSTMLETVRRNMPYGKRINYRIDGDFDLLINEKVPACSPGSGALGAYILRLNPRAGIRSAYGSIDVMLLALGDCARLRQVRKYTKNLLNDVDEQLGQRLTRE